ncbi:hypothetical protein N7478_011196 [Penicillium angulare]|uniref:uncharacterized protein n=1 Tax=Penicillium angulare TaxID=116970 RepID=UPI00253F7C6C|nr:uncharacterized protein N7478_011196 [Penicillium angulare]KAJ5263591.1 hypothetical protein N7478_011196 [Penicillium angulare]
MAAPTPMYDEKIAYNSHSRELSTPSSHSSTPSLGENASYYGEKPPPYGPDDVGLVGPDGERGLGSTLMGGAAGGYVGHQMGGGMATAGGAVLGALGANAVSHGIENHHQNQQAQQQQQQQQYYQQQQPPPPPQGYPPQGYYPAYQQAPYPSPGYAPSMPGTTVTTTTHYNDCDRHGRRRRKEKDCCIGRILHGGCRRDDRY